jgi:FKBP-type peptidyl-prolyl cis-trans isomerase
MCGLALSAANGPVVPATAPAVTPATKPAPATQPVVQKAPVPQPAPVQPAPVRPVPAQPAPVQPTPEKHEPVALPPLPTAPTPAPVTPIVHAPVTQPIVIPAPPVAKATTQPGPIDDQVAYAFGRSAGQRIHDRLQEDGRVADHDQIIKGFIDGLDDHDPAFPREKVQAAFAEYLAYTQQRRAEQLYADNPAFRKRADENLQKSQAVLDQNAEMAQVEVRADGVQVQELNPGTGRVVGNAKTLTVKNLRVSLADGTLIKTTDDDKTEKIATADALPALMDAVRGMRVGTRCRIWLPPDKAYGLTGKPPLIGPNEAIECEFELVNAE